MSNFAIFHIGGDPDNHGNQDFSHLLEKGLLWIGGKQSSKKEEVHNILDDTNYLVSYKSKKLYNDNQGWYDIYQKTGMVHDIDSVDKWKIITDSEPSEDTINYFQNHGVDFLVHVKKVYDGKVDVPNLPKMRRIQTVANPESVESLMALMD